MKRRVADEPDDPAEFLDADADAETEADEVDWLDGVDEDEAASASTLPAGTTRHRAGASLLLVGAVLAVTMYSANSVYHHDITADAASDAVRNELILAAPASPGVSIPGLDAITSVTSWTGQLRTEVAVSVVNRGPDPVTLLPGATLLGSGVTASSFGSAAAAVLAPGQTTVLSGYVTVDCVFGTPDTGGRTRSSLTVSARTAGGGLGVSTVVYDGAGGSIRDRVCTAQTDARSHGGAASGNTTSVG